MTKNDIRIGGTYMARIGGKFCQLRVIEIVKNQNYALGLRHSKRVWYRCKNLNTGREVMVRSAIKFRSEVDLDFGKVQHHGG